MTPLFNKMNYKGQPAMAILNAPESFGTEITEMAKVSDLALTAKKTGDNVPFVLVFTITAGELAAAAQFMAEKTTGDALCWIAYPKSSSKRYKCEFNRDSGFEIFGPLGFEPVRMVAIDEDWSALRFRRVDFIKTMTRSFAMTEKGKEKTGKA